MNDGLSLGEIAVFCLLVVFFRLPFWQSPTARAVMNCVYRFVARVLVGLAVAPDMLPAVRPQPAVPLTPATPWQAVVAAYLDAACDSRNTRRAYARHLRDAFTALAVATVDALTGADLAAYRARVTASDLS